MLMRHSGPSLRLWWSVTFSPRLQCRLPSGCWEVSLCLLEGQPVLLSSDPSLQPPQAGFTKWLLFFSCDPFLPKSYTILSVQGCKICIQIKHLLLLSIKNFLNVFILCSCGPVCHSMDVEVREQFLGVSSSGDQAQPVGLEDKSTSYLLSHLACPTKCISR